MIRISLLALGVIGCSASDDKPTSDDPVGFVFKSAVGSLASFGWSGEVHQISGPAGTPFGVTTTECKDGVCSFVGPTDPGGKVNRHRCLFRMSIECTADSECPLEGGRSTPCVYIYDAPITQKLDGQDGKTGACAWSYIPVGTPDEPTIAGRITLSSGALTLDKLTVSLPLNAKGASAPGSFYGACSECVGDPTPNDGVKEGRCHAAMQIGDPTKAAGPDRSADEGRPCDVHRSSTIAGFAGNYSMDCSPTVIRSEDPPLAFGGSFRSAGLQISLDDQSPRCTDGTSCFCGMCEGSTNACMANSDCASGRCVNPSEEECVPKIPTDNSTSRECTRTTRRPVYSNRCVAGTCNWDDTTGVGTCKSQGSEGKLIACYPGGGGIRIDGRAERDDHIGTVYNVSTGAASCIPLTRSDPLNAQLGLPGLLYQKRNFQIIPAYAEDKP